MTTSDLFFFYREKLLSIFQVIPACIFSPSSFFVVVGFVVGLVFVVFFQ